MWFFIVNILFFAPRKSINTSQIFHTTWNPLVRVGKVFWRKELYKELTVYNLQSLVERLLLYCTVVGRRIE